jgi:hypothetical protein
MRRTRIALLALPALLLGARALQAQQITSPYRYLERKQGLTGFAGYLFTDPKVTISKGVSAEFGPRSAPLFGARYNISLSNALALDFTAAYSPSERKLYRADVTTDPTHVSPVATGTTARMPLLIADAGVRINLTGQRSWHELAPYAAATGGLVTWLKKNGTAENSIPTTERFDFGPGFALGAKVGTDFYATPRLSLNVELSDRLWKVKIPTGFQTGGTTAKDHEWNSNYGATVGAAIHF